jgi:hypothetical protein
MFRETNAEGGNTSPPPALIGCDELQLVIPGRVGLHQSPPPLHQLADSMRYSPPARREFFSERQTVSYSLVSAQGSTSETDILIFSPKCGASPPPACLSGEISSAQLTAFGGGIVNFLIRLSVRTHSADLYCLLQLRVFASLRDAIA